MRATSTGVSTIARPLVATLAAKLAGKSKVTVTHSTKKVVVVSGRLLKSYQPAFVPETTQLTCTAPQVDAT